MMIETKVWDLIRIVPEVDVCEKCEGTGIDTRMPSELAIGMAKRGIIPKESIPKKLRCTTCEGEGFVYVEN